MKRSVTFVNRYFHPDHSATSQILSDLAFGLAEDGWDVAVVTSRQIYDDPLALLPEEESIRGVAVHRLGGTSFGRMRLMGRLVDYVSFHAAVYRRLRELEPERLVVAMTDPPLIATTVSLATENARNRLVIWTQDLFPEIAIVDLLPRNRLLHRFLRFLRDVGVRGSAVSVAVGRPIAEELATHADRIRVVPNWALEESAHRDTDLRSEWGLGDELVVGYSGNFGRVHDFEPILQATLQLRDTKVRFLLTGGGSQYTRIETFVRNHDLQNVFLRPYQPRAQLGNVLAASDVHLVTLAPGYERMVVPSKFYGIAAAGRAVLYIGSRDGEIARLVEEHHCGIVVNPGDGATLVRVIRDLSSHRERVQEMGRNARRAWQENWTREQAVAKWDELLRDVWNRGGRHRSSLNSS